MALAQLACYPPVAGNAHRSGYILWRQRSGAALPAPGRSAERGALLPGCPALCCPGRLLGRRLEPRRVCSQAEGCTADAISAAGHSCGMSGGPQVLHQQHLFSVLTHVGAAEGFQGALPEGLRPL